jgi:hypothetical protein
MDRSRAELATQEARHAINDAAATGDTEITIRIAADATTTRLLDEPRTYCPARLPCLGLTGVRIAVPVRVVSTDPGHEHRIGEQVGEVSATYCAHCRAVKADERETS